MTQLQPREIRTAMKVTDEAFSAIKRRGIMLQGVQSIEDYEKKFEAGIQNALLLLSQKSLSDLIKPECFREVHGLIFADLYTKAGQFRNPREIVTAGRFQPADPARILQELELCELQTRSLLLSGKEDAAIIGAVFLHVRQKGIQPCLDGNKRTSRLLASVIMHNTTGTWPHWGEREDYLDALKLASGPKTRDLTALVNMARKGLGLAPTAGSIISPFRIRPFLLGDGCVGPSTTVSNLFDLSLKIF